MWPHVPWLTHSRGAPPPCAPRLQLAVGHLWAVCHAYFTRGAPLASAPRMCGLPIAVFLLVSAPRPFYPWGTTSKCATEVWYSFPNPSWTFFQNLEVNWVPRSDTIFLG